MLPISVIMPTCNTELSILKEAVESILTQTVPDFEFIIIDDGSANGSDEYLNSLRDERIRIIRNPQNIGITKSLNIGLKEASGKYIARMDADDISMPTRFEKQYAYMESHPDVVMCGSWIEDFGQSESLHKTQTIDRDYYRIKTFFYYPGPQHPTMFIRKEVLDKHRIVYDERLRYAQDYNLCVDLGNVGQVVILQEKLVRRRIHQERISNAHSKIQKQCALMIQKKLLLALLPHVTGKEVKLHYRYSCNKNIKGIFDAVRCLCWYIKLICANNRVGKYPKRKFMIYTGKLYMLILAQYFMPRAAALFISMKNKMVRK